MSCEKQQCSSECGSKCSFKLIYFDARGKAELIRLIFAAAGKEFEDSRVKSPLSGDKTEWLALKPNTPFGQLPVLEITDKSAGKTTQLAQSNAIGRALARKFGLAGKDDLEQALVDMYVDQVSDVGMERAKFFWEKDEAKKKTLEEAFKSETVPKNLSLFEKQLANNNTGYLVGSGLTWADLALFNFLDSLSGGNGCSENSCEQYPNVNKLVEKIRSCPKISKWLTSRPHTQF